MMLFHQPHQLDARVRQPRIGRTETTVGCECPVVVADLHNAQAQRAEGLQHRLDVVAHKEGRALRADDETGLPLPLRLQDIVRRADETEPRVLPDHLVVIGHGLKGLAALAEHVWHRAVQCRCARRGDPPAAAHHIEGAGINDQRVPVQRRSLRRNALVER